MLKKNKMADFRVSLNDFVKSAESVLLEEPLIVDPKRAAAPAPAPAAAPSRATAARSPKGSPRRSPAAAPKGKGRSAGGGAAAPPPEDDDTAPEEDDDDADPLVGQAVEHTFKGYAPQEGTVTKADADHAWVSWDSPAITNKYQRADVEKWIEKSAKRKRRSSAAAAAADDADDAPTPVPPAKAPRRESTRASARGAEPATGRSSRAASSAGGAAAAANPAEATELAARRAALKKRVGTDPIIAATADAPSGDVRSVILRRGGAAAAAAAGDDAEDTDEAADADTDDQDDEEDVSRVPIDSEESNNSRTRRSARGSSAFPPKPRARRGAAAAAADADENFDFSGSPKAAGGRARPNPRVRDLCGPRPTAQQVAFSGSEEDDVDSDLEQPAPKLRRHDQPTGKKRALQGLGDADDEDGAQPAQKFGGRKPRVEWSREEVKFLLEGYSKHWNVVDCWTKILDDSYDFHPCRTGTNLKDKFRNLVKDGLAVDKRKEKGGLKHKGK